ncbi:MAG TPA: WbuC family cupin fold metalloprotein [Blastocatellia bacterium]|nr:WbuC family cupin fold metalloprotein [Blastocatellia bacterium]HMX26128.1 WbuC family cupin fold metalloprotein [Blastocatellia bacterium]HNG29822.1 WbuC family cupin fold metalloprotein [Blastocatellia bacterium]
MNQRPIQTITSSLLDELLQRAAQSVRRRAIHCLHSGDWEHCHRMLNALTPGTYVRPHRHDSDHQSEAFVLLRGKLALLLFDEDGNVDFTSSRILSPSDGLFGMDIPPRLWHSLVALEAAVIYEVKGHPAGGYVQERDKNFAPWSPEENSPESEAYLRKMEEAAGKLS